MTKTFDNDMFKTVLLPWIFFPLVLDWSIVGGIAIFLVISLCFFIMASKQISFDENHIRIEKYRLMFKRFRKIRYEEISFVSISVQRSFSYDSTFVLHFKDGTRKEKTTISNSEVAILASMLKSKKVSVKSNIEQRIKA